MERINQFEFYDLGRELRRFGDLAGGVPARAAFFTLTNAERVLRLLLTGKPVPLGVSRTSAEILHRQVDALIKRIFWVARDGGEPVMQWPPPDVLLSEFELDYLKHLLSNFETVFGEEMREATTYYVPRRGIFYTPALVDYADATFPTEVQGFIPDKTRIDWCAAGRCIAFNLLSASGFHVARAVEGVLESYYQTFLGKPMPAGRSWGHHISDLEKVDTAPAPQEKTLAEIRQMKDDYRNPLMHPRVVLSEGDARMLFANGESLIIAMAQEIKAASAGVQPGLALVQTGAATP